jgi:hypothetical protein
MHPDLDTPTAGNPPCVVCPDSRRRPSVDDKSQACAGCLNGLRRDLTDWPELVALLPAAVAPSLQAWREPGARSSGDSPLPGGEALNLTAAGSLLAPILRVPHFRTARTVTPLYDPAGKLVVTLERWAVEPVLDSQGQPATVEDGDQYGPLPPVLILTRWTSRWAQLRAVGEHGMPDPRWLAERLDWAIRDLPDLAAWAHELHTYVDEMRALLGVKRYVQRYREPCPRCDMRTLSRVVDPLDTDDRRASYVRCGNPACGTMWTLDEWAHRTEQAKELAA